MSSSDIISTLPDVLLCHILSFLETKQSFATTILSKRWQFLWLSLPTLCFNARVTNQIDDLHFKNFVYSILLQRDTTFPIKSFQLDVTYDYPLRCSINSSITKWVNFVIQRGVECIYLRVIRMFSSRCPKVPITILTCRTLVVLNLYDFDVEEGFPSIVLPSLKTLHLKYIRFPQLQDFMLFLAGCPILEDLYTHHVFFESDDEFLTSDEWESFDEWKSFFLRNLTRADIFRFRCYFPLNAVHNVHSLRFEIKEVLYLDDMIPTFHNLTQLELICLDCYSWEFIVEVLNHCPKLQKLDIDQGDFDDGDDIDDWVDPNVVPECLSLHLRNCNLINFLGLQSELMLAKYILKNASVLQTMEIWNGGQAKIERKLSSFPRASSVCELIVHILSLQPDEFCGNNFISHRDKPEP